MSKISQIRLLIGDTLPEKVFTDEEITFFLGENKDCIYNTSASLLEAWATKYAAAPESEHIGDYSYKQSVIDNMIKLSKTYRERASNKSAFDWAVMGNNE